MARRPRVCVPGLPLHVVQRGNDRRPCFFADSDYFAYLTILAESRASYAVLIHAYVLMTNHVHLLVTPPDESAVSRMMQSIGARYVRYVNKSAARSGTLWEGRYRSSVVESDAHLLATCRYIDLNPVRAGIVAQAFTYRWSSYGALTDTRQDRLVTPHEILDQLGSPRGRAYARFCDQGDRSDDLSAIREATASQLAFGSDTFKLALETTTSQAMYRKPPGFAPRQR